MDETGRLKMRDEEPSITMTLPEACRRFGIGITTGRELARQGRFPGAFRIGKVWRVHREIFDQEVERLARGGALAPGASDEVLKRALSDAQARMERRP